MNIVFNFGLYDPILTMILYINFKSLWQTYLHIAVTATLANIGGNVSRLVGKALLSLQSGC